jgi:hypothetical protein
LENNTQNATETQPTSAQEIQVSTAGSTDKRAAGHILQDTAMIFARALEFCQSLLSKEQVFT